MVQKLGPFTEGVDFAYWWSFSGGGSAIKGATSSSLINFQASLATATAPSVKQEIEIPSRRTGQVDQFKTNYNSD